MDRYSALLALALIAGSVVGHYAGQGFNSITEQLRGVLPLIVVPWLAVNAIRDTRDLRRMIAVIAVLTVVKAGLGLLGVLTHVGVAAGATTITYYEPAVNWLAMGFIMMMLASAIQRVPTRRVAQLATLIVVLFPGLLAASELLDRNRRGGAGAPADSDAPCRQAFPAARGGGARVCALDDPVLGGRGG